MIRKEYLHQGFSFILSDDGKTLHRADGLKHTYLGRVSIPEGVEEVMHDVFRGCVNLTEICIPASVKKMDVRGFDDCCSLCAFVVDEHNEHFMSENGILFDKSQRVVLRMPSGNTTTHLRLSDNVCEIREGAFRNCHHLQTVYLPDSVTVIGDRLFMGCDSLCDVRFPRQLEMIKDEAFKKCPMMKKAVIPPFVKVIDKNAFDTSVSLVPMAADSDDACENPPGLLFDEEGKVLVKCSIFYPDAVCHVPEGTERICAFAFLGCRSLKEVHLPHSVKSIGENAFMDCVNLDTVTLPSGLLEISKGMFGNCLSLVDITLPDGLLTIGDMAFIRCNQLQSIIIPDSVTCIGERAFGFCSSLCSVRLPETMKMLGDLAFEECTSLKNITIPKGIGMLPDETFRWCTSLKEVVMPDDITEIGSYSFLGCTNLRKVNIPSGVNKIDYGAFSDCHSLKRCILPSGLTEIKGETFFHCHGLKRLIIPEGVTRLGDSAVRICSSLEYLSLPSTLTEFVFEVFEGCNSLRLIQCHYINPADIYCHESHFMGVDKAHCVLQVPPGTEALYRNHPTFGLFENIVPPDRMATGRGRGRTDGQETGACNPTKGGEASSFAEQMPKSPSPLGIAPADLRSDGSETRDL